MIGGGIDFWLKVRYNSNIIYKLKGMAIVKKRICIFVFVIALLLTIALLLVMYINAGTNRFETGSVTLIANGIEHEPVSHMSTASVTTSDGVEARASSQPFSGWLERNISTIPRIPYADDLQIVVTGRDAVGWWFSVAYEYGDDMVHIPIPVDNPSYGRADIPIPDEPGTYLVQVTVQWGRGGNYAIWHYVFRIVR